MDFGITQNLTLEEYLDDDAYAKTDIVNAARSPKYVKQMRAQRKPATSAMIIGTAVHLLILEPERAKTDLVVVDIKGRRGKTWDAAVADNPGKTVITSNEWETVEQMAESVAVHPRTIEFLTGGMAEVSCKCEFDLASDGTYDSPFYLPIKCRPDYLTPGRVIDVKTARDVTPDGFGRAAYNYHYHWSAALTLRVLKALTNVDHVYYFLTVENVYPFETVIYKTDRTDVDLANEELRDVMGNLANAHETKRFDPIAANEILNLTLPKYAYSHTNIIEF